MYFKRRLVDVVVLLMQINDVEDKEDDKCEINGNGEDESVVQFELLYGFS